MRLFLRAKHHSRLEFSLDQLTAPSEAMSLLLLAAERQLYFQVFPVGC